VSMTDPRSFVDLGQALQGDRRAKASKKQASRSGRLLVDKAITLDKFDCAIP
jgi:hypothetical protein